MIVLHKIVGSNCFNPGTVLILEQIGKYVNRKRQHAHAFAFHFAWLSFTRTITRHIYGFKKSKELTNRLILYCC